MSDAIAGVREVIQVIAAKPTLEGAGVRLMRAFARPDPKLDPFLLFDDFGSEVPADYLPGFPWHPHRGIETITYVLEGAVAHGDSLGNKGVIGPGEVQWMTAGSGIIHEEMPRESKRLVGFQLWANLPAAQKMIDPKYRDVRADDIPLVRTSEGVEVKVICGSVDSTAGPVKDIAIHPEYLDVAMRPGTSLSHRVSPEHNAFAYVVEGDARFDDGVQPPCGARHLVVFGAGDRVSVTAGNAGARLLLVSGAPLREPVAWGGPIVMNTQEELTQAFEDYRAGTFTKPRS
jgi:redox-sensitive bicupin YhaK (pirin superfamily)